MSNFDSLTGEYQLDARDRRILDELVGATATKVRSSAEFNHEAEEALRELPYNLGRSLEIHGFRSHVSIVKSGIEAHRDTFEALIKLIRTGRLRGGVGRLYEGQLYADAPFLIFSKPNEPLIHPGTGKVQGFCLVNGQYSRMVDDFRAQFPSIPFVTPDDLRKQWHNIFTQAIEHDPSLGR